MIDHPLVFAAVCAVATTVALAFAAGFLWVLQYWLFPAAAWIEKKYGWWIIAPVAGFIVGLITHYAGRGPNV